MGHRIAQRGRLALGVIAAAAVALGGCGRGQENEAKRLSLTGSSTIAPLMVELGRRYEEQHPGVRIEVQTGGSSRGVVDARSGAADIGMVSRALKPEEADLHAFTIARDGIGVIVHRDNPIKALTSAQIVALYTGKARTWAEVGGGEGEVVVVNKAEGRSTLELFVSHFKLEPTAIRADVVIGDNAQGIKTVAANPLAIGYVSIGTAEVDLRSGVPIRLLPLDGVEATTATVADGTFPLARPLNLVTRTPPEGLARDFLDFCAAPANHDLITRLAFVPPRP